MKWVGSHVYCVLKVVTRFTADKITGNKKIVWLHYAMYLQGIGDFKEFHLAAFLFAMSVQWK
jgi:hypothetical protein